MKAFKRIGAIVLAGVMVLGLSITAFAEGEATMTSENGVIGEFTEPDTPTVQNNSVVIYKEITAYNPDSCTVNAPTITFNYTIGHSASLAGKGVTDANSHHNPAANSHAVTKEGVGTPTITGTDAGKIDLVPGTNTLLASVNGTANRFSLTISFDGIFKTGSTVNYPAGIYRYQIDENTTETQKNAAGIKEGTVANTLYMDVYVNGSGDIYGYVLFTDNEDIDASPNADADAATAAGKIEGFVGGAADKTAYTSDTSIADKYYTFNLSVEKIVTNDDYTVNTKHPFPFELKLTNSIVTANVLPIMNINDNTLASQNALTASPITGTTWAPKIASGGIITYTGIPTGTTVDIKEQNDVTGVMYSSSSANADEEAQRLDINTNMWSNTAIVKCNATALQAATENHTAGNTVIFTNNLLQISPTGVVLRIAPYALMLAAGLALLLVSRRRRRISEEA